MAKSFKQLSADAAQPVKRTSEKDLLDFLEQDWLTAPAPVAPAAATGGPATDDAKKQKSELPEASGKRSKIGNTINNGNLNNTGNTSNINNSGNTTVAETVTKGRKQSKAPRQTESDKASTENQPRMKSGGVTESINVTNEHDITNKHNVTSDSLVTSITDVTSGTTHDDVSNVTAVTNDTHEHDVDVRQTFVLGQQYLERLKNYVHTQRMSGQYDFTQKQALHQALDLLFATAQIQERPLQIRQKEEVRRQQIRKGKSK